MWSDFEYKMATMGWICLVKHLILALYILPNDPQTLVRMLSLELGHWAM